MSPALISSPLQHLFKEHSSALLHTVSLTLHSVHQHHVFITSNLFHYHLLYHIRLLSLSYEWLSLTCQVNICHFQAVTKRCYNCCRCHIKILSFKLSLSNQSVTNTKGITLSNQEFLQISKSIKAAQHTIRSEVKPQLTKSQFISFN